MKNTTISRFANYKAVKNPEEINLLDWLKSDEYADQVDRIREIEDKAERNKLKAKLPCITPSGVFSERRENCLIKHSGFLQFDIDDVENPNQLKEQISNIKNVAYCGLSVSGNGIWGLVPIKFPNKHKEQFRAMESAFKKLGLTIDPAPKNPASLRGYSYDPDAYFNTEAVLFEGLHTGQKHIRGKADPAEVEHILQQIEENPVDITEGYENWLKIGFALSDGFGEAGRDYFHRISQYNIEYDPQQTDDQYSKCLKAGKEGVSIRSFFHVCQQYGLQIRPPLTQNGKSNGNTQENGYCAASEDFKQPLNN